MPELPEVETTKTSIYPLIGQTVTKFYTSGKRLREYLPNDLSSLVGYQFTKAVRRAKYLLLYFTHQTDHTKKTLLVHLGMSGSLQQRRVDADKTLDKHDHMVMTFIGEDGLLTNLYYHDPRRFGIITWADNDDYIDGQNLADKYLAHLGVEPLENDFNGFYLYHKIWQSKNPIKKPIKTVIMDQTIVVGVGNIYAAESLFLSHIHPVTPAHSLTKEQLKILANNIKIILDKSIKKGGSSLKDFMVGDGKAGYFQQTLLVYGREGQPCLDCGTLLENIKITGRASVYCPHCQSFTG